MSVDDPEIVPGDDAFERFALAGFERLGIDADEAMLAVMAAADSVYRPYLSALLQADLTAVALDAERDMSQPPADPPMGRRGAARGRRGLTAGPR